MRLICGVDEAGRGPLAGPVYAAAVILDPAKRVNGLADSKVLTAERREVLAERIKERAIAWAVAYATVDEIDRINILRASLLAMRRAVESLQVKPDEAWIDGNPLHLTTIEFALLEVLVRNAGRALTREYLTDAALGRKLGVFDRTIDVHISNLRKKLDAHRGLDHIKTVRGSGSLLAPRRANEEH